MNIKIMVDDRQFYISKEEVHKKEWISILLNTGWYLNYHYKLNVVVSEDGNLVLCGYAWNVLPNKIDPFKFVSTFQLNNVIEKETSELEYIMSEEKTWCGRYVLIYREWILLDFAGLMNIFYSDSLVTTSLNVYAKDNKIQKKYPKIKHDFFPDFIPGQSTAYLNMNRLLPSQIYNYVNSEVIVRKILPDSILCFENDVERIDYFIKIYTESLRNMTLMMPDKKIFLALTGGGWIHVLLWRCLSMRELIINHLL